MALVKGLLCLILWITAASSDRQPERGKYEYPIKGVCCFLQFCSKELAFLRPVNRLVASAGNCRNFGFASCVAFHVLDGSGLG